jgi:hypothetical protein
LNKQKLLRIINEPVDSTSVTFKKTQEVVRKAQDETPPPISPSSVPLLTRGDHPILRALQHRESPPEYVKVLNLLAAHTASGNLSGVSRDWSYIPKNHQKAGLEVILQTALFGGFQRTINALETVHEIGVDPSALEEEAEVAPQEYARRGENLLKLIYTRQEPKLR